MQTTLDKIADPDHIYSADQYLDEMHQDQLGVENGTTTIVGGQVFDGTNTHESINASSNGVASTSCKMIIQNESTNDEQILINDDSTDTSYGLVIDASENYVRDKQDSADGSLYLHFIDGSGSARVTFIE